MSRTGSFLHNSQNIEVEIVRKGVALGIDWTDEIQIGVLARESLDQAGAYLEFADFPREDRIALAKFELFGLAALMLKTTQERTEVGLAPHEGQAWKAFRRALYPEMEMRGPTAKDLSRIVSGSLGIQEQIVAHVPALPEPVGAHS